MAAKEDLFGIESKDESEYDSDEIEEKGKDFSKSKTVRASSDSDSDEDSDAESSEENDDEVKDLDEELEASDKEAVVAEEDPRFQLVEESATGTNKRSKKKVKPLTTEELEKFQKEINKTGVVYLSRIPPFMKPVKLKQLLSKYAEIGRIYLAPEDPKIAARRKKYAKNNKQNFTEGWVEFKDKKQAKAVAAMLNTQQIGGKKKSFYYYDLWNIKYLPKFKWHHLTEQRAYEAQARQQRLRAEIAHATRENKTFITNVGKSKMINKMEDNKKRKAAETTDEHAAKIRRSFEQRGTVRREADPSTVRKSNTLDNVEPKMKNVLGKVFGGK